MAVTKMQNVINELIQVTENVSHISEYKEDTKYGIEFLNKDIDTVIKKVKDVTPITSEVAVSKCVYDISAASNNNLDNMDYTFCREHEPYGRDELIL